MITIDGAYKTVDGVLAQLSLTRDQHVQLQNNLRFLYDVAKEAQESKEVEVAEQVKKKAKKEAEKNG